MATVYDDIDERMSITVDVLRVSDACGYAVPKMELVEERGILDAWAGTRNATSVDGLPGLPAPAGVARN